jgi:hypothetical protein
LTAGLDCVDRGAAMLLDADGQDPPELIGQFVAHWRAGYDDIYGTRLVREGEGWLKRGTAALFYRVIGRLSKTPIPADTGDFRLLSPRALAALRQLRERHRFMKGLFAWVGFRQVAVPYARPERAAGTSSWRYWKLWNFALDGITSFSTAPIRVWSYVGLVAGLLAVAVAGLIVIRTLLFGRDVPGYPSLMVVILMSFGLQMLAIGSLGEYVARIYQEVKGRPLYVVMDRYGFEPRDPGA